MWRARAKRRRAKRRREATAKTESSGFMVRNVRAQQYLVMWNVEWGVAYGHRTAVSYYLVQQSVLLRVSLSVYVLSIYYCCLAV